MGNLSKHFDRKEFACHCGCGRDTMDYETILVLEDAREHFGVPIRVNSGYRCIARNKAIGGASNSQHLYGRAADIHISTVSVDRVAGYLEAKYPGKYGIGRYNTFTHVDTRTNGPARWRG